VNHHEPVVTRSGETDFIVDPQDDEGLAWRPQRLVDSTGRRLPVAPPWNPYDSEPTDAQIAEVLNCVPPGRFMVFWDTFVIESAPPRSRSAQYSDRVRAEALLVWHNYDVDDSVPIQILLTELLNDARRSQAEVAGLGPAAWLRGSFVEDAA
jgi:hypothetical protein